MAMEWISLETEGVHGFQEGRKDGNTYIKSIFKSSSSGTYKYSLYPVKNQKALRRGAEQIPASGQKSVEFSSRECRFYSH